MSGDFDHAPGLADEHGNANTSGLGIVVGFDILLYKVLLEGKEFFWEAAVHLGGEFGFIFYWRFSMLKKNGYRDKKSRILGNYHELRKKLRRNKT